MARGPPAPVDWDDRRPPTPRPAATTDPPLFQESAPVSQIVISEEARHWQQVARKVAEEVVRPVARHYDEVQEYPEEVRQAYIENGLLGVWIPKEYGGHGAGIVALCLVVEELSRACGGTGVAYAVNALGSFPILVGGTEEQKQKYLPQIARGEKMIAFCLSEKFAGSDAGSMRCRAVLEGDEYVIRGEKKWTTNGGVADIYTVFAVTDPNSKSRRISAFVVERPTPGFSIEKVEDKMGIRAVPVVETHFDGVRVGKDALLGGRAGMGFKHAMQTLDFARPGVAAQGVGLAQGALEYAVTYALRRQQFGQNLASMGVIMDMLGRMGSKVEAARGLVLRAATAADAGEQAVVNRLAAMAKSFSTDVAMEVTTDAVQIFGGYGFMKDYPVEKYMRDAKITQIYEGTNQIQRMVVARNLIKEAGNYSHIGAYIPTEEFNAYGADEAAAVEAEAKG
ncbi:MAG: acyl-CoA dehydrogenase family protein [Planctomycetes bacterium]|nr:acyl-CoA dehydrogenase family protein [Planctomycetota bacterium]